MEIGSIIRSQPGLPGAHPGASGPGAGGTATAVSKWERNASCQRSPCCPPWRAAGDGSERPAGIPAGEMTQEEVSAFLETLHRTAGEGGPLPSPWRRSSGSSSPVRPVGAEHRLDPGRSGRPRRSTPGSRGRPVGPRPLPLSRGECGQRRGRPGPGHALLPGPGGGEVDQAEEWLQDLPPQPLYDKSSMQARLALARKDWAKARAVGGETSCIRSARCKVPSSPSWTWRPRRGGREDIAPLADAACALTHCFGLWPYETWSVRLQQALLTEDVEGGLTAQLRPTILRELTDPDNSTHDLLRGSLGFGRWWRRWRAERSPSCANETPLQ